MKACDIRVTTYLEYRRDLHAYNGIDVGKYVSNGIDIIMVKFNYAKTYMLAIDVAPSIIDDAPIVIASWPSALGAEYGIDYEIIDKMVTLANSLKIAST